MTHSAITILASCAATRPRLSPEALYSVIRPTSINAATAASRCRSICLPRNPRIRLIILGALFLFVLLLDLRHFAKQVVIEHRPCDRPGASPAVPAVFDEYG